MAAADKIIKALKGAAGVAKKAGKQVAKDIGKVEGRAVQAGMGAHGLSKAMGSGKTKAALDALAAGTLEGGRAFSKLGPVGKLGVGAAGAAGTAGSLGMLSAMGMMAGGDDEEMAEIAERSGLPLGGNSMASMRMAMMPAIQKKLSSEVLSGRDPSRILSRIERDIYEPLARQSNEMGEGEADDLYSLTEGMARVLYADAPEQDKLAALYELAGME